MLSCGINLRQDCGLIACKRLYRIRTWAFAPFIANFPFCVIFVDRHNLRKPATDETMKTDKPHDGKRKRCYKQMKSSLYSNSLHNILSSPASSKAGSIVTEMQKIRKEKRVEAELPVFQTEKKYYAQAHDYQMYHLTSKSLKYNGTVSSYIAKLIKKVKSNMKEHFFDTKVRVCIICF